MEILFFTFFLGLAVGSFLNCLIYRLESGESFLKGRSFCPKCKHLLSWKDLIPILSFVFLKGKCRYCQQKISLQYPLVEISTAILFLAPHFFYQNFNFFELFFYWIFVSCSIVIFVYDLKNYSIPDKVLLFAIFSALIYRLFRAWNFGKWEFSEILIPILSATFSSLFFFLIWFFSRGKWMGQGDIELVFFLGLILGWPKILVALLIAFFSGATIGLGLVMAGKKSLKSEIPFAPFLVGATIFSLFFGQKIVDWYLFFVIE